MMVHKRIIDETLCCMIGFTMELDAGFDGTDLIEVAWTIVLLLVDVRQNNRLLA
jgi:hypothetical protein